MLKAGKSHSVEIYHANLTLQSVMAKSVIYMRLHVDPNDNRSIREKSLNVLTVQARCVRQVADQGISRD
jgi:hypothetical protein